MKRNYKSYDRVGDIVNHNTRYCDMDFETLDAMKTIKSSLNKLIAFEVYRTGTHDMITYYMEKAASYCEKMQTEVEARIEGKDL